MQLCKQKKILKNVKNVLGGAKCGRNKTENPSSPEIELQ
jgi:hypothetical protein